MCPNCIQSRCSGHATVLLTAVGSTIQLLLLAAAAAAFVAIHCCSAAEVVGAIDVMLMQLA